MVSILPVNMGTSLNNNIYKNFTSPYTKAIRESMTEDVIERDFPWVKDKNLIMALNELKQVTFNPDDVAYLNKMGVVVPFVSGEDAVNFLKEANVRILFDDMEKDVHAQYDFSKNFIKINKRYKNTSNTAEILAIAEAILHEAGHAKDKDNHSSMQEEIDFLGTNALAHRDLQRRYPHMFSNSKAPIVEDGVSVYEKLFFDPDLKKELLVKRLQIKYGYLPAGGAKHPASNLAIRAKGLSF